MEDPNFRRWPVAVWLGNDFSSQHSYNREKMSQAISWGPSPGPVFQGVNLAPI